ncbi:MAG TPA: hypothetical protein PLN13_07660 [Bacteroidia bacterium]|nr:hypothetical protein [Bacteroidia bacterium]HRH08443.1 hypothetical protein [Bacteroidia bacterium]
METKKTADIETLLNSKYDNEIENVILLDSNCETYVFELKDGESSGLYSAKLSKIILEPGLYFHFKYHEDWRLISYENYRHNYLDWIDLNGELILYRGEIIKVFSHGFYLVDHVSDNFSKTMELKNRYIYFYSSYYEKDDNEPKSYFLISNIEDAVEDENGHYLLILKKEFLTKEVGVFDLKNSKWIHEMKKV